jgi:predicted HNH restriction endonuclease
MSCWSLKTSKSGVEWITENGLCDLGYFFVNCHAMVHWYMLLYISLSLYQSMQWTC